MYHHGTWQQVWRRALFAGRSALKYVPGEVLRSGMHCRVVQGGNDDFSQLPLDVPRPPDKSWVPPGCAKKDARLGSIQGQYDTDIIKEGNGSRSGLFDMGSLRCPRWCDICL